jgi:hypothetical protein
MKSLCLGALLCAVVLCIPCGLGVGAAEASAPSMAAARVERHCRQLQKELKSRKKKIIRGQEGKWWMWYWDPNWCV